MENKDQAIKETVETVATQGTDKVSVEDLESRNAALEAERAKLIEEAANYKLAFLKEKKKKEASEDFEDETEEERIRRITIETLKDSRLAEIAREQDALLKKALKENKELKLATHNRTDIPASIGTHSESVTVKDTLITQEQLNAFKARGWSDKDIERYKRNLVKNSR